MVNKHIFRSWLGAVLGMATVLAFAQSASALFGGSDDVVQTTYGPVQGTVNSNNREFLGIPYAAPPVGDLRWAAPEPPEPWSSNLQATELKNGCPQLPSPFGIPSTDEDCLFLNVYTPEPKLFGGNYAVMVWIHGGAFVYGDGGHVDPQPLVDKDVIVVTLNYRLGALGFLSHPELDAESPTGTSGNYGIQDQQAALRWVRDNIAQFGGNPNNVTIFGESAGGFSVHTHLVSPDSAGLFDRAIVQSGAYSLVPPTLAQTNQHGVFFANMVCGEGGDLACLRSQDVSAILAGPDFTPLGYFPNVDGVIIPQTFLDAFTDGNFNKVPVIEGSNRDEWRLFVALQYDLLGNPLTAEDYPDAVEDLLTGTGVLPPEVIPAVLEQYPLSDYSSPAEALSALGTDAVFACGAHGARQLLALNTSVWGYEFDDPDAPNGTLPPVSFPYYSFHGAEIQYLMETRDNFPTAPFTSQQQTLSNNMVMYWTQFAKRGNPNGLFTIPWARYFPLVLDQVQLLTPPLPLPADISFGADHKCDFWISLVSE